ncbi:MTA SAH nucleosidase [Agrilactobacillus composti DSM 18527 = JCM 14202]|uniref:adenosylhomocysteine nucleosidase n=1 Tax=Agrilactobacillus composti DSM 18527 = JCM 14202 TaxID=1423734 RepID=X0PPU8_9LACO|nr:5'-methylthioadenosine/adenosylhomocysteine nucleosidase [Agrilactobacillus composti]KRM36633.1 MTA SAH nucleosidase [Agrilactobacillus composti DSM 18527 = JCM 14202]GAF39031.1 5'-methylthioadenosine nucleosidase [Agrilactobacillus composti DSM 18527 = JCM 14202]
MKLGVICAMPEEIALLVQNLTHQTENEIGGVKIYSGKIGAHELYLCESGIGKVQAALTATLLAQIPGLDALINTGSAGGIGQGLKIGETVVSTALAYTDVDVTGFGYALGQLPNQPLKFEADSRLVTEILAAVKANQLQATAGLIVSGDQFVNDPKRVAAILKQYPDVLANEMEGAAVAQVATQFKLPFVVIRALSDVADSQAATNFDDFIIEAGRKSAEILLTFLKDN